MRTFGAGGPTHVVVDPIDGSVNAKRGIPFFSLSLAVADGPTLGDVRFGFVHDFGAGEEWVGERGGGAWLNGRPLDTAAQGSDRDPLLRGNDDRVHRRPGSRHGRSGGPAPGDGIARPFPLSPRRGARRRRLLAEAGALDRHRRGTAAGARAWPRDRALRGAAVRGRAARSRGTLPRRRGGDPGALLSPRRRAQSLGRSAAACKSNSVSHALPERPVATLNGAALAAPFPAPGGRSNPASGSRAADLPEQACVGGPSSS